MSVERFKGAQGMAFIGAPSTEDQTADVHMYAGPTDEVLFDTFKIEDIVAAVNALPGVTATYTPPEPELPELPKALGSVITSRFGFPYVRVSEDSWYSGTIQFTDDQMGGNWLREATIKEGPGA